MISVTYCVRAEPWNGRGTNGWNFADEYEERCRYNEHNIECVNWRGYVKWCVNENRSVLHVWVNDILVWDYDTGWCVDIDQFNP